MLAAAYRVYAFELNPENTEKRTRITLTERFKLFKRLRQLYCKTGRIKFAVEL